MALRIADTAGNAFQGSHLAEPSDMTFRTAEPGRQKRLQEVPRHGGPDGAAAHAEDIHIVIFNSLAGREVIMDQPRANPGDLVGAHGSADPAAADGHAPVDLPFGHGTRQRNDRVRVIVGGVELMSAEIDDLMAGLAQLENQVFFQLKSAVIRRDADTH